MSTVSDPTDPSWHMPLTHIHTPPPKGHLMLLSACTSEPSKKHKNMGTTRNANLRCKKSDSVASTRNTCYAAARTQSNRVCAA